MIPAQQGKFGYEAGGHPCAAGPMQRRWTRQDQTSRATCRRGSKQKNRPGDDTYDWIAGTKRTQAEAQSGEAKGFPTSIWESGGARISELGRVRRSDWVRTERAQTKAERDACGIRATERGMEDRGLSRALTEGRTGPEE